MKPKNRLQIAEMFRDKGFVKGAEVGVFDGYYSEILCQTIPGLMLYSIDPWEIYHGYRDERFLDNMHEAEATAQERLGKYNVKLMKQYSVDAAPYFNDGELDFVYIDGNHQYKSVKQDLELWTPKVRKGGIIAGDDYYMTKTKHYGVIDAVHEFTDNNGYDLQITPWARNLPREDDWQPQYWFVK